MECIKKTQTVFNGELLTGMPSPEMGIFEEVIFDHISRPHYLQAEWSNLSISSI